MTGRPIERCCPPTEPCPECLAYYAWLNRDLDPGTSAGEHDRNAALAAGFNEHVTKPAEPAQIREILLSIDKKDD